MKNLEEIKELLIVVDMVNGFVKSGALADAYIQHIVPDLKKLIEFYAKKEDGLVAFIRDAHTKDSLEFKKFPVHCVDGTWESEIIDEFKPYVKDGVVYKKNSRSFMFAPNFMNDLERMRELKKIVVTGCCTDLCDLDGVLPMMNYLDQVNRNVEVIVPKNVVETYDAPWHNREEYAEYAFKLMEQEGIKLVKRLGGIR